MKKALVAAQCVLLAAVIAAAVLLGAYTTKTMRVPSPQFEGGGHDGYFTAVWVATVYGLDFSGADKTEKQMKADLDRIVEVAEKCNLDAIYFQVRACGDAFYKSNLFPWSKWASGEEGKAPENGFDPLDYLCREASKKGVEVHAWINPYRLSFPNAALTEISAANTYKDLAVMAENGAYYLDPGRPESRKLVFDGVKEVLENYPVSGVVFDDYFYPSNAGFDDENSYAKYGGGMSKEDWRRSNTYALVKEIHDLVKGYEGKVFGVSPFGVWQNRSADARGSDTRGLSAYSAYYADTYRWVKDEIVDYISPQIYWAHGDRYCDFKTLAKWWNGVVVGTDVRLYVSHAVYKLADGWNADEIKNQLDTLAGLKNVCGSCFYRYSDLKNNTGGMADWLAANFER